MTKILTEMDAREAAINGATVRYRRHAPYLFCPLCRGDGTNSRPFSMECGGPHDPGWEIVDPPDGERPLRERVRHLEDKVDRIRDINHLWDGT